MATAPDPVVETEPNRRFQISLRGRTIELSMEDLGPGDDLVSRQQTGFPVQSFFDETRFGPDSLLILWWMARRKNGETRLKFAEVLAEFPTYKTVTDAGFELELVEEGDSPEV